MLKKEKTKRYFLKTFQVEFYQAIQRSIALQSKPPKLVQGPESIHPAGTALGIVLHKMPIITIFGCKHFNQKFHQKHIFLEKFHPSMLVHILN